LAYINQIETALPQYNTPQEKILEFMLDAYTIPDNDLGKVKALYARSGIKQRNSIVPDFNLDRSKKELFLSANPSMQARMQVYMKEVLPLCMDAINKIEFQKEKITHFITVSCTGMSAPGIDILLMQQLGLNSNLVRTSVNFMGCYAAVHALKLADAFCATDKNAQVLIVLVEACTIHFQHEYSIENVATSMLFSDGAAAILVSNEQTNSSFFMHKFYSEVHGSSLQDMTWNLTDLGFKMSLSAYVPDIIAENIKSLLSRALIHAGLDKPVDHWAIHPGGKKIIQEIKKALEITDSDVADSINVLSNYGNMSSVTLPFVLKEKFTKVNKGESVFSCAFGPGLTMETLVLIK
jgi:predicted naringenin-chalcone synthase